MNHIYNIIWTSLTVSHRCVPLTDFNWNSRDTVSDRMWRETLRRPVVSLTEWHSVHCSSVWSFPSSSVPGVGWRGDLCIPLISESLTDKNSTQLSAHTTSPGYTRTGSHNTAIHQEVSSPGLVHGKHRRDSKVPCWVRNTVVEGKSPQPRWLFQWNPPYFPSSMKMKFTLIHCKAILKRFFSQIFYIVYF